MTRNQNTILQSAIKRICTGPELSKDIDFADARDAMLCILDGRAHAVQAALFLIGLRIKRESDDEYKGIQQALIERSQIVCARVDEVVALSNPYNGFTRHLPASPFLPAVLAALDIPTVSDGLETVAPKFGITHKTVLRAAGKQVDISPQQAAERLADPAIGWSYLDQSQFCPALHALVALRSLMIKRPVIATSERLIGPVRGRNKTHLIISYVHKAYPRIYSMLAEYCGFASALLIKGVEGGITPSLRDSGKMISYAESADSVAFKLQPSSCEVDGDQRAQPMPEQVKTALNAPQSSEAVEQASKLSAHHGIAALEGRSGYTRDCLVYTGAVVLTHLGRYQSMPGAADAVRSVLDNRKASAHFEAG